MTSATSQPTTQSSSTVEINSMAEVAATLTTMPPPSQTTTINKLVSSNSMTIAIAMMTIII